MSVYAYIYNTLCASVRCWVPDAFHLQPTPLTSTVARSNVELGTHYPPPPLSLKHYAVPPRIAMPRQLGTSKPHTTLLGTEYKSDPQLCSMHGPLLSVWTRMG